MQFQPLDSIFFHKLASRTQKSRLLFYNKNDSRIQCGLSVENPLEFKQNPVEFSAS